MTLWAVLVELFFHFLDTGTLFSLKSLSLMGRRWRWCTGLLHNSSVFLTRGAVQADWSICHSGKQQHLVADNEISEVWTWLKASEIFAVQHFSSSSYIMSFPRSVFLYLPAFTPSFGEFFHAIFTLATGIVYGKWYIFLFPCNIHTSY